MSTTTLAPPAAPAFLMSADDFLRDYGDAKNVELVDGKLVRHPMPGPKHGEIGIAAGAILRAFVKPNALGRVTGLDAFVRTRRDPDGCRGADVAFISFQRLPKSDPMPDTALEVSPELILEVLSPTDRWSHVKKKMDEYLAAGVLAVGLLDVDLESLTIHRADEFPQTFHNGDTVTIPDVLPGFSVPVKAFFE
jgi:Uma2 family endonuclease